MPPEVRLQVPNPVPVKDLEHVRNLASIELQHRHRKEMEQAAIGQCQT
jgi:hypothetical protein